MCIHWWSATWLRYRISSGENSVWLTSQNSTGIKYDFGNIVFCCSIFACFTSFAFPYTSLEFALEQGILINADNYQELEVITEIMKDIRQVHGICNFYCEGWPRLPANSHTFTPPPPSPCLVPWAFSLLVQSIMQGCNDLFPQLP